LDWKELVGFIGGFLTTMGMVPQVWRLFKLKSAHEISLTFSLFFIIGIVFWLVYGILNGLMSVIIIALHFNNPIMNYNNIVSLAWSMQILCIKG